MQEQKCLSIFTQFSLSSPHTCQDVNSYYICDQHQEPRSKINIDFLFFSVLKSISLRIVQTIWCVIKNRSIQMIENLQKSCVVHFHVIHWFLTWFSKSLLFIATFLVSRTLTVVIYFCFCISVEGNWEVWPSSLRLSARWSIQPKALSVLCVVLDNFDLRHRAVHWSV